MFSTNGQPVLAEIKIQLLGTGQVAVNATGADHHIITYAIGQAISVLAQKAKEAEAQKIQVAPAGLINRIQG